MAHLKPAKAMRDLALAAQAEQEAAGSPNLPPSELHRPRHLEAASSEKRTSPLAVLLAARNG